MSVDPTSDESENWITDDESPWLNSLPSSEGVAAVLNAMETTGLFPDDPLAREYIDPPLDWDYGGPGEDSALALDTLQFYLETEEYDDQRDYSFLTNFDRYLIGAFLSYLQSPLFALYHGDELPAESQYLLADIITILAPSLDQERRDILSRLILTQPPTAPAAQPPDHLSQPTSSAPLPDQGVPSAPPTLSRSARRRRRRARQLCPQDGSTPSRLVADRIAGPR